MSKKSILVVEDEPVLNMLITEELQENNFSVTSALDGAVAIQILESGTEFDFLYTDINLPGVDGWSVAKAARKIFPSIGIIYSTGYVDKNTEVLEGGLLLRKPFRIALILSSIEGLIRG